MIDSSTYATTKAGLIEEWGTSVPASGSEFCAALSSATDALLVGLFEAAIASTNVKGEIASSQSVVTAAVNWHRSAISIFFCFIAM